MHVAAVVLTVTRSGQLIWSGKNTIQCIVCVPFFFFLFCISVLSNAVLKLSHGYTVSACNFSKQTPVIYVIQGTIESHPSAYMKLLKCLGEFCKSSALKFPNLRVALLQNSPKLKALCITILTA